MQMNPIRNRNLRQRSLRAALVTLLLTPAALLPAQLWAQAKAAPNNKKEGLAPNLTFSSNELPTYIRSNTLSLFANKRQFYYIGDVEIRHGDLKMSCEKLEGSYGEDNQLISLTALENVYITKGADVKARGEKAVYDRRAETLILTDNPELQRDKSVLTADVIKIFLKENRSTAEGRVRMKLIKPPQEAGTAGASSFKLGKK